MNRFAENLRFLITSRGITQRQLAGMTDSYEPNISRILTGKEGVTIERAERIAKSLGVSLSELLSKDFRKKSKQTA